MNGLEDTATLSRIDYLSSSPLRVLSRSSAGSVQPPDTRSVKPLLVVEAPTQGVPDAVVQTLLETAAADALAPRGAAPVILVAPAIPAALASCTSPTWSNLKSLPVTGSL